MISITINSKKIQVNEGVSLLEAASVAGFEIPVMCNNGELEHFTSCMVCIVKDSSTGAYIPACSAKAVDMMDIITEDDELSEARKTAIELLLSEHVGDCEAPCRVACPAFMDIPQMNRLIAQGKFAEALKIVKNDIALPGVLGRICPAPCEGACKRKPIDQAVSICLLKRFAFDEAEFLPEKETVLVTDKKVAIIGSGPAGLSAAYYLQLKGIQTSIFDSNEQAGGAMRYSISDELLEKVVLDKEIEIIKGIGVKFFQHQLITADAFKKLRNDFDAVVIATGDFSESMANWGLENNGKQILVNKINYLTNLEKVFAIGNANRSMRLAIRSAAQGKEVATAIEQMFQGQPVNGELRRFNSTIGKLLPEEYSEYLKEASSLERQQPESVLMNGFSAEEARKEASRCMHCDCRKPDQCLLRNLAERYKASKKRFAFTARKPLKKVKEHSLIVYEPGKCIKCGICVRLTGKYEEEFGFTFIGRGFDVEIGVPFNEKMNIALQKTAEKVAEACPTGALAKLAEMPNGLNEKMI
jgi:NADPH-dependent glutamate synthase beta subunit-like oxidoreductase